MPASDPGHLRKVVEPVNRDRFDTKGPGPLVPAPFFEVGSSSALVEQRLGLLRALGVLLLHLAEEGGEFLVALVFGVLDVLVVGCPALERVVEHAHQVVAGVAEPGVALSPPAMSSPFLLD